MASPFIQTSIGIPAQIEENNAQLNRTPMVASTRCPSLKTKRVSPHVIRHGTAMALLQAGVDIAVIAVWLGHESIETTNVYVHANLAMKEKALAQR